MVAEHQHVGLGPQPLRYGLRQRQAWPPVRHEDPVQPAQPLFEKSFGAHLHRAGDGFDAMDMHDHPLRHQRMHRRLYRRAQAGGVEFGDDEFLRLLRLGTSVGDGVEQRLDRHRDHDVVALRVHQPGPGRLDPEYFVLFDRGVAAGALHEHRIGADPRREPAQRGELGRDFCGCDASHQPAFANRPEHQSSRDVRSIRRHVQPVLGSPFEDIGGRQRPFVLEQIDRLGFVKIRAEPAAEIGERLRAAEQHPGTRAVNARIMLG